MRNDALRRDMLWQVGMKRLPPNIPQWGLGSDTETLDSSTLTVILTWGTACRRKAVRLLCTFFSQWAQNLKRNSVLKKVYVYKKPSTILCWECGQATTRNVAYFWNFTHIFSFDSRAKQKASLLKWFKVKGHSGWSMDSNPSQES